MRLFFGIGLDETEAMALDSWRTHMLPPLERPVPAANFHLTLTFIGNVRPASCEQLCNEAAQIRSEPFSLTLDELGFFSGPGILWAGPSTPPTALMALARATASAAGRAGLRIEKRPFRPHVTLARRCELPPPAGAQPPALQIDVQSFALFESVPGKRGVRYEALDVWSLAH